MLQEYYAYCPFLTYNVLNSQVPDIKVRAAFGDGSGYYYFVKKITDGHCILISEYFYL